MADDGKEGAPRIIKVSKKGHGGHHGGAWKVAYADFVTAMMALFIVLWIMAQGDATREGIANYFSDPFGPPINESGHSVLSDKGAGIMKQNMVALGSGMDKARSMMGDSRRMRLAQAAYAIQDRLRKLPELSRFKDNVIIVITPEGMRIELINQLDEDTQEAFFECGSAKPTHQAGLLMQETAKVLLELDNNIVVEGHTDSEPFSSGFNGYSNWELSADRANAIRRLLMVNDMPEQRINEVRAYAAKMPLPETDPSDARNRRVSILVKSEDQAEPLQSLGDYSVSGEFSGEPAPTPIPTEHIKIHAGAVDGAASFKIDHQP